MSLLPSLSVLPVLNLHSHSFLIAPSTYPRRLSSLRLSTHQYQRLHRETMPNFYSYQGLNPSALNSAGAAGHWEDPADWPRTFYYVSAADGTQQGIHPPAPVYQSNQPSQPAMYYFAVSIPELLPLDSAKFHLGQFDCSRRLLRKWSLLRECSSCSNIRLALHLLPSFQYPCCQPFLCYVRLLTILHSTLPNPDHHRCTLDAGLGISSSCCSRCRQCSSSTNAKCTCLLCWNHHR